MANLFKTKLPDPPKPVEIPDQNDPLAKRKARARVAGRSRSTRNPGQSTQTVGDAFTRATLG